MRGLRTDSRKVKNDTCVVGSVGAKSTRGVADNNDCDTKKTGENDVNKLLNGDPSFDNFTAVVRQLIHVPIAVVCLIEDKKLHEVIEQRRQVESCGSVRVHPATDPFYLDFPEGRDVYVIDNCRKDPRTCASRFVLGAPYIRFYAGTFPSRYFSESMSVCRPRRMLFFSFATSYLLTCFLLLSYFVFFVCFFPFFCRCLFAFISVAVLSRVRPLAVHSQA